MQFNPLIDTVISIVLIYIILSMLSSFILELFAEANNLRGNLLRNKLKEIFHDPTNQTPNVGQLIYKHPLIKAMMYRKNRVPENINSNQFAEALNDIIKDITEIGLMKQIKYDDKEIANKDNDKLSEIAKINNTFRSIANSELKYLYGAAYKIPDIDPPIQDPEKYKEVFGNWFETLRMQLTIIYKRKTRLRLFIIGLLLAIIFKCDSIYLVKRLYTDEAMRTEFVNRAQTMVNNNSNGPIDSIMISNILEANGSDKKFNELSIAERTKILYEHAGKLPISRPLPAKGSAHAGDWIRMIFGIIISATAVIFGAPFWYDTLRKIVRLNDTVKTQQS